MGLKDIWNGGTGGKIGIIAGACCIGLILIVLIGGAISPDANTKTTTTSGNSTDNDTTEKVDGWQVQIITEDSWSGSVGGDSSQSSYQGKGNKTIDLGTEPKIVSASIQKKGQNSKELKVQILKDGEVKEKSSTTAEFGVATASASDL
jgi:hypothetical protein